MLKDWRYLDHCGMPAKSKEEVFPADSDLKTGVRTVFADNEAGRLPEGLVEQGVWIPIRSAVRPR